VFFSLLTLALACCQVAGRSSAQAEPLDAPAVEAAVDLADVYRLTELPVARRPLPMDAYPLNLGLPQARRLVADVLEGRTTVVVSEDELVYYGGGVSAYPRDARFTTITINWKMIAEELGKAEESEPFDPIRALEVYKTEKP
jgi:hypothetical protein